MVISVGHKADVSMLCPLPETDLCQNPNSQKSNLCCLGEDVQLTSLESAPHPGLAETAAWQTSDYILSLSKCRADAVKILSMMTEGSF